MKPNRLSTKKHTLRFAVILSALILAGCASTQSTTSSTSASSASSTASTVSTSEESGADETDSTGGAMNGTIGSVIEANLSFKNKDFYIDYSTEDTVKIDLSAPKEADGVKVSGSTVTITEAGTYVLSGTLTDGQIIIDAGDEDDVRLVLENASIICTTTAPIYAKNADKVIISLPENTESTVTDTVTGTDGNDALTAVNRKRTVGIEPVAGGVDGERAAVDGERICTRGAKAAVNGAACNIQTVVACDDIDRTAVDGEVDGFKTLAGLFHHDGAVLDRKGVICVQAVVAGLYGDTAA